MDVAITLLVQMLGQRQAAHPVRTDDQVARLARQRRRFAGGDRAQRHVQLDLLCGIVERTFPGFTDVQQRHARCAGCAQ